MVSPLRPGNLRRHTILTAELGAKTPEELVYHLREEIQDFYNDVADLLQFYIANRGCATVVAAGSNVTVVFESDMVDDSYQVNMTPSWSTTTWVSDKTKSGFKVNVGSAPGSDSIVYWIALRGGPPLNCDEHS